MASTFGDIFCYIRGMKVKELLKQLNDWAPYSLQESYDNSGLMLGDMEAEISGVMINLDITKEVILEAAEKGANVVLAHHPVIFSGIKKIIKDGSQVNEVVIAAIKQDINLISLHTNLDATSDGVNAKIADKLGLLDPQILVPNKNAYTKLRIYTPTAYVERIEQAVFSAGAGHIGNYDQCSYVYDGMGRFRPLEGSMPSEGEVGKRAETDEQCLEILVDNTRLAAVSTAMMEAHPYETPAYDMIPVSNSSLEHGMGMLATLPEALSVEAFAGLVKEKFGMPYLRHSGPTKKIKTLAYCGGSGSFLIDAAAASGADAYLTADIKYHDFFRYTPDMCLLDMGHYEMEQFSSELIFEYLSKKNDSFALHLSSVPTNPIHYY